MKLGLSSRDVAKYNRRLKKRVLPKPRMENNFLRVYQIYFDWNSLQVVQHQFPDYIPFSNDDCTVFFEAEVMRKLIEEKKHLGCDYFGVVSYKLKEKLGFTMKEKWQHLPNIANHSTNEFTPELFENELKKNKPDIMSFQRHMPHDPILQANKFHPNFISYWKYIMDMIGFNWEPVMFKDVFYCNYFVARPEIYEQFVVEMLAPAMDVMKTMPELYLNSGYPNKLPNHLKEIFNIDHYPYHAFICERMFSYWVYLHNYKTLHY